jgi:hypothetical protein
MQAAGGELQVMRARKPIDKVLADPKTPESLRDTLTEVKAAREFASRELKLPDNRSYRTYADVHRQFVVWNVVATPEFSVHPETVVFSRSPAAWPTVAISKKRSAQSLRHGPVQAGPRRHTRRRARLLHVREIRGPGVEYHDPLRVR